MTVTDEDILLDINIEEDIECTGVYDVCYSGEPVEWMSIFTCCNKRKPKCDDCFIICRRITEDIIENHGVVVCRNCRKATRLNRYSDIITFYRI